MKKTLCVAAFLALIVPTIGQAANTGKLRACTIAWPPYTISKNEDGKLTGIDVDILREIARRMNKDIKISDIPWKRCLRFAEDGNIDIVFSASKKPDRKKYLLYPQMPLHELKYVFVTKPDDKIRQSWEQNMDLSVIPDPIGIPLGFSIAEKLRRDTKARIYEGAKDDEQNLQLLLKDRVNSIVIESIVAKWAVNANNASDKVQILDKRPYTKDGKRYYITVSKKYGGNETEAQKLVSEIDHHLKEMQTDGTTQKIVDSYLRSE